MSAIISSIKIDSLPVNLIEPSVHKPADAARPCPLPYFNDYRDSFDSPLHNLTVVSGPPFSGKTQLLSRFSSLFTGLVVVIDLDGRFEILDSGADVLVLRPSSQDEFVECMAQLLSASLFVRLNNKRGNLTFTSNGMTSYQFGTEAGAELREPLAAIVIDGLGSSYWSCVVAGTWAHLTTRTFELARQISARYGDIPAIVSITSFSPPLPTASPVNITSVWPMLQGADAYIFTTRISVAQRLHDARNDESDSDWLKTSQIKISIVFIHANVVKNLGMIVDDHGVVLKDW
ncbi:hypothetical protein V1525DRAFT_453884 [Lipomyces kononenkoae]|uniref:Uncharacterized protein n=1 Tax=Lipomyces kononenkoae TaxID=34357 RepID=A0ACC3T905_LIPKO